MSAQGVAMGRVIAAVVELACARAAWERQFAGQSIIEVTNISAPFARRVNEAHAELKAALAELEAS